MSIRIQLRVEYTDDPIPDSRDRAYLLKVTATVEGLCQAIPAGSWLHFCWWAVPEEHPPRSRRRDSTLPSHMSLLVGEQPGDTPGGPITRTVGVRMEPFPHTAQQICVLVRLTCYNPLTQEIETHRMIAVYPLQEDEEDQETPVKEAAARPSVATSGRQRTRRR